MKQREPEGSRFRLVDRDAVRVRPQRPHCLKRRRRQTRDRRARKPPPKSAGELRTASSALPPAVLAEVDARIEGEPLDAAAERAARAADWR